MKKKKKEDERVVDLYLSCFDSNHQYFEINYDDCVKILQNSMLKIRS